MEKSYLRRWGSRPWGYPAESVASRKNSQQASPETGALPKVCRGQVRLARLGQQRQGKRRQRAAWEEQGRAWRHYKDGAALCDWEPGAGSQWAGTHLTFILHGTHKRAVFQVKHLNLNVFSIFTCSWSLFWASVFYSTNEKIQIPQSCWDDQIRYYI